MELIRTPKIENVKMLDRLSNSSLRSGASGACVGPLGTLYLTATHLIFVDPEGKKETWILHSLLSSLEKQSISTLGTPLHIRCKNFQWVTFVIPKERDAHDVYTSLYHLSQPLNVDDLYCFQYTASNEEFASQRSMGWDKFDLLAEYRRQGAPNKYWVVSAINKEFEVCDTYPRYLWVPSSATTPMLLGSTRFRSRGRLPVLSYLYLNGAAICRCSQPLSGFSARCLEDEMLLNCIVKTNDKSKVLYVVDTRPKVNAYANKAAGKGFENENFYENIKFHFFGIENIHVMRGSLQKLMEACEMKVLSVNAFLSSLEGSGWLKHVKSVLETATFIANAVEEGISVLVHCSDGWDRTAQTCSLAALLLDPYYRTFDGFQVLIEKEWLAFGHKFNDRCGHIQTGDSKEMAPVFSQFIDSIWQISQQFPFEFEFNEKYLLALHDHVYSCQFGTFIGNCDKDRVDLRLKDRTYSLWAFLDSHRDQYVNPFYATKRREKSGDDDIGGGILRLNCAPQLIRFWRNMYNRFDVGVHPRESISELMVLTYNHITSLEEHIKYLEERIKERTVEAEDSSSDDPQSKSSGNQLKGESFDSIDMPLKVVKECMERLEKQQKANQLRDKEERKQVEAAKKLEKEKEEKEAKKGGNQVIPEPLSSEASNAINKMVCDMESVSLEWQSFRNAKECLCSYPFDQTSQRYHCWCCGRVFCLRCIDKKIILPGHRHSEGGLLDDDLSSGRSDESDDDLFAEDLKKKAIQSKASPVCQNCYKSTVKGNARES